MTPVEEDELGEYLEDVVDGKLDRYSMDIEMDEEYLTVSLTYPESERPPFIGKELESLLDYRSFTFNGDLDPDGHRTPWLVYSLRLEQ